VLVVDDERNIRRTLQMVLAGEGYTVRDVDSAEAALTLLATPDVPVDLIVLDLKLPGMSGLEFLRVLRQDEAHRDVPVLVISGHANATEAVAAIQLGAADFFEKPLVRERILVSVANSLGVARSRRALAVATREAEARYEMIGESPVMQRVFLEIEKVAPTKTSVLITGESGTGKELVSRAIHRLSPRRGAPFIRVNCAAIPRELIESELFGHVRGAFTGAQARKRGFFEQAHGGTLFLDEIGDMDLAAQAKVLRALQSGEISPVGSEHVMHVDVRVLAATNKDLAKEVERGSFRQDLYFRLAVFPLRSPSLRERVEDIPRLAHALMARFAEENGTRPKPIEPGAIDLLMRRRFPGNVRELKNVVERAAILSLDRVTVADLPEDPHASPFDDEDATSDDSTLAIDDEGPASTGSTGSAASHATGALGASGSESHVLTLRQHREQAERAYILETLRVVGWNISRAATLLGVERTNLHKKIRSHGIKRGEG
jgi:DNA-binding NtrC family response regulator